MATEDIVRTGDRHDEPREGEGKRALIMGLRGFTGQYMARELAAAGYRVYGTVQPGAETGPDAFAADLLDRAALAAVVEEVRPDVVVHLAAIAFVAHDNAEQMYRVNVAGTRNLLEALAQAAHKPSCVLLPSSANIYGNAAVPVIDESVAPAPANDLGNLAIARDFSDVRMVVKSYRRLLAAAPAGDVFNVCSGRSHSLESVLDMMSDIAGYRIDVHVNPAFVRAGDVETLTGSNAKLAGETGAVASPPLVDTLRWMYEA
jgi:nucleoside-diphosphate-sugar epimerase